MNQQNSKKEGGAGASVKAEMAALGAAVFDPPRVLGMMADWGVKESWFADEVARDFFKVLFGAFTAGETIDELIAVEKMRIMRGHEGAAAVEAAMEAAVVPSHAAHYLGLVRDMWFNRSAKANAMDMCEALSKGEIERKLVVAEAVNGLTSLLEFAGREKEKTPEQVREAVIRKWEDAADGKCSAMGAPWPMLEANLLTMGMVPGLHIVAARPSVGKTVFEGYTARNLLRQGWRVARVCLDMAPEELLGRDIVNVSGVSLAKLKTGQITPSERGKVRAVQRAMRTWADREHLITARTSKEIVAKLRAIVAKHGAEKMVVTLDYIQLVDMDAEDRIVLNDNSRVARASSRFKAFSLATGVPMVVLSQLSRGTEKEDRIPQLSDLRDSGSIEQDASTVAFLYPCQKVAKNWMASRGLSDFKQLEIRPIVWDLLKGQNSATGRAGLRQYGKYFKFEPADLFDANMSNPMDSDFGYDFGTPRAPFGDAPDLNRYVIARHPKGAIWMFEKEWFDLIYATSPEDDRYEPVGSGVGAVRSLMEMQRIRDEVKAKRAASANNAPKEGRLI